MNDPIEAPENMNKYYLGLISRGPLWTAEETPEVLDLQERHQSYIDLLTKTGKIVLAGPFLDDGELRGVYVFDADSFQSANDMAQADPSVKAGRLIVSVHPWMIPQKINKATK